MPSVRDHRLYRIGTVGHRTFSAPRVADFVAAACRSVLRDAVRDHSAATAVSALAEGTDMLFAEAALDLGLPLETVRPFDDYEADFSDPVLRRRYQRLRGAARQEIAMPYHSRSEQAYAAAMRAVVQSCDLLVIAWDGTLSPSGAGTTGAVALVQELGRRWVHIDVRDCSIKPYPRAAPDPDELRT
ncbi:MAG TPA: hypothetical protein VMH26_21205 [Burkholderiales bacterium]|nr:hypothetical protein [Burkholderiales bacterium]